MKEKLEIITDGEPPCRRHFSAQLVDQTLLLRRAKCDQGNVGCDTREGSSDVLKCLVVRIKPIGGIVCACEL